MQFCVEIYYYLIEFKCLIIHILSINHNYFIRPRVIDNQPFSSFDRLDPSEFNDQDRKSVRGPPKSQNNFSSAPVNKYYLKDTEGS